MCDNKPLVTAIITTHKRAPEIVARALSSVIEQTYENMEIIVVDDSPADFSMRDEVRRLVEGNTLKNTKYIAHEACKGACAARNTGLAAAKGEFVAFLDDDDEWLPEKIEVQLTKFENEQTALVYSKIYRINDTTGVKEIPSIEMARGSAFEKLIEINFIGSTSIPLLRTKCLREIGGFDVLMQSAQDYDVWLRLAQKYEVDYCQEPLVLYHIHDGDRISANYSKRIAGQERIMEKHITYLRAHKKIWGIRKLRLASEYGGNQQLTKALCLWFSGACLQLAAPKHNLRQLKLIFMKYKAAKKQKAK